QHLKTRKELTSVGQLFTQNGQLLEVYMTYIYIEGLKLSFCLLVIEENSEGEPAEARASSRISDKMMRHSVDAVRQMVFWIDRAGNIIYANEYVLQKTHYTFDELKVMKAWQFSDAVQTKEEWVGFFETVKKNVHYEITTKQYRKSGGVNYVRVISTYMEFEEQAYIFSIVIDVTEKKQQEIRLNKALDAAARYRTQLENERNYLKQEIDFGQNFNEIITQNKHYQKILQQIQQVATTDAIVLILGETGTGKELVARAIHNLGERSEQAMIKINCAALPTNLIESELFGHEKGAFTGAYQQKIGRFELANGGTIFLDEIGEVPMEVQAKLLRVLQEGEFNPLGSNRNVRVDVRVIAATNRNLKRMILDGRFREDLYYRLNVFPIYNIPLRERRDDIELLTQHFMKKYAKKIGKPELRISKAAMLQLQRYEFPGNIRELENLVERATIVSRGEVLNLNAVLPELEGNVTENSKMFPTLRQVQRQHILEALKRTNWRITGKHSAAELLQMNGKTLVSRMKKLNIKRDDSLL
ncbi:MAG: sigma 54-interacting transcriptional regulator, partial [Bacteroidota bacterium]